MNYHVFVWSRNSVFGGMHNYLCSKPTLEAAKEAGKAHMKSFGGGWNVGEFLGQRLAFVAGEDYDKDDLSARQD